MSNEAITHDITNQTEEENEMWAEKVYQKNRVKALTEYLEMLLNTHEVVPLEIQEAINDRIAMIRKGDV